MNFEDEGSFGDLLARYRTQARMSQEQLASCLGVHRSTIVKWELKGILPRDRTRVEEIARCLKLTGHQYAALFRAALLPIETPVADRIRASGERLDWKPYLSTLVTNYTKDDSFASFIPLRKFDAVEQTHNTKRKLGILELDAFVDHWLRDNKTPHLAILGGYGTGKTWYCHWLAHRLATSYLDGNSSGKVPVLISLRLFAEAADLPSVLELYWDHMGYGDFTLFKQAVYQGDVLVILDGFDEMSLDFREQVRSDNFLKLRRLFTGRSKVIITSRDTYFMNEEEQKRSLTPPPFPSLDTGLLPKSQEALIRTIYLDGFNRNDIRRYFTLLLGEKQGKEAYQRVAATYDLPDLASRPILANIIAMTFQHIEEGVVVDAAVLYDRYTRLWMERESWRLSDVRIVRTFMQHLAVDMQLEESATVSDNLFDSMMNDYFRPHASTNDDLWDIKRKIQNCSFLTRDSSGLWSFIHRSFMEFFCAQKCYTDFITGVVDFTSSFPLTQNAIDVLTRFLNIVLPTKRLAQARFALASGPGQERAFFSDMLVSNNKVDEFGQFLIRSRVTVWGYKFFEHNEKLEMLVDPSILERLKSDFDWDYYLMNRRWYRDIPRPNSLCRIQYADQP